MIDLSTSAMMLTLLMNSRSVTEEGKVPEVMYASSSCCTSECVVMMWGNEARKDATNAPCATVLALRSPRPPLSIGHLARSNWMSVIDGTPAM